MGAASVLAQVLWMVSRGRPGPLPPPASVKSGGGERRTLTVIGHGSVSVPPDEALVALSVQGMATSAREALAHAEAAMQRILALLKEHGIAERQIHTSRLHIAPEYHHDERGPQPVRYRVSNAINVFVEDLPTVGELLDGVVAAGGDSVAVQQVALLARDTGDATARARTAALALARQKAQQIARDAGVTLGELLSITEEMGGMVLDMRHAAMGAAYFDGTSVRIGELEVSAALEVVWALA